ncbi:DUF2813 domain-containing protein [Oceanisphaera pacifica]|uniref:DUF2813 domain-containing protein n=1 Tax=Oceanisphaera pacifica TaxID=2818389 RepID=A0ABS3NDL1_9GAMM|nr:DUF2813 domain-containing protein [Oceanisphaera pacifica]MBO1518645.1 DUF2813 domain-containing protein [Oceanisphaera pacifica]
MFLEHIQIRNFMGLNQLSLTLHQSTALMGENAWGKTSLFRALWRLMGQGGCCYQFIDDDFYRPDSDEAIHDLQIVLTYREHRPGISEHSARLARLEPAWIKHKDGFHRVHYCASAKRTGQNIISHHGFTNAAGVELELDNAQQLVHQLIEMNPVFRLRDSRGTPQDLPIVNLNGDYEQLLTHLSEQLAQDDELPQQDIKAGLDAVRQLLEHYFTPQGATSRAPRRARDIAIHPVTLSQLGKLNNWQPKGEESNLSLALSTVAHTILQARGGRPIETGARPLLLIEDPESRLHPTMLAVTWGILDRFPGQKLVTTNSGDLLSAFPLHHLRRLVRLSDQTKSFRIGNEKYNGEDMRRIAFHVRINRPMSLFARYWLLVEGETEIWLLNELARICGYILPAEGIRIIEFAQCGYSPLIKVARDFGIGWHLLTDGDEAGQKYAQGVRSLLRGERETNHLTVLPHIDIERYLFDNGLESVFRQEAQIFDKHTPASRIIERALSRRTKPGMALAVIEAIELQGVKTVPKELRRMFARMVANARQQG